MKLPCDVPFLDLSHWFVTSTANNYTYRNVYCAMCNGEKTEDLDFWDLEMDCSDPSLNNEESNATVANQLRQVIQKKSFR